MNLISAENLARELFAQFDLRKWNFRFDRARRRFGSCDFSTRTISLSQILVELNPPTKVRDTILHEIAHALVGPRHAHGAIWKSKIVELGGDPRARFRENEVEIPAGKFVAICRNCGKEFPVFRRSGKKVACRECCRRFNSGKFSAKFLLEFREN